MSAFSLESTLARAETRFGKLPNESLDQELTELLAKKVHAIVYRGTRRDFFDLYILLQTERLGIFECQSALALVYQKPADRGLFLRAFSYFDDAAAEAPLPSEGPRDFKKVTTFFAKAVGALVVPPHGALDIQSRTVAVSAAPKAPAKPKALSKPRAAKKAARKPR